MLDCSGSMGYGSDTVTKLEFARTLASALASGLFIVALTRS